MIERHWRHFNMVTRDHFYHSGAKLGNRRAIVEAPVFNFDSDIDAHNFGMDARPQQDELLGMPVASA